MNEKLFNAIFDSYCNCDFKYFELFPKDDPGISHNEQVLAEELGLNEDQKLELSDLISTAMCEARYTSFKDGLIIGATLERLLHGDADKLLQSIAKNVSENV